MFCHVLSLIHVLVCFPISITKKMLYFDKSPLWHSIKILAYLLALYLAYVLALYLANVLAFCPADSLAFYLALYLASVLTLLKSAILLHLGALSARFRSMLWHQRCLLGQLLRGLPVLSNTLLALYPWVGPWSAVRRKHLYMIIQFHMTGLFLRQASCKMSTMAFSWVIMNCCDQLRWWSNEPLWTNCWWLLNGCSTRDNGLERQSIAMRVRIQKN